MALQKTIYTSDNTGVAATYWCACDVHMDFYKKHGSIKLMGHINKQVHDENKNPVIVKEYEIRPDLFDAYFSEQILNQENVNTLKQVYLYIKDYSGDFSDAEIV